jgi:hypothetical protein
MGRLMKIGIILLLVAVVIIAIAFIGSATGTTVIR